MLPDIFGFPTIMNMVDDEQRDNEEMVQLAADRVRRLIVCDCQVFVESENE